MKNISYGKDLKEENTGSEEKDKIYKLRKEISEGGDVGIHYKLIPQ